MFDFYCIKCKQHKIQKYSVCKVCFNSQYRTEEYKENREKIRLEQKIYNNNHKEERKILNNQYRETHKEEHKISSTLWSQKNIIKRRENYNRDKKIINEKRRKYYNDDIEKQELIKKRNKKWYNINKENFNKRCYQKRKIRLEIDLDYYIYDRLSSCIRMAIINNHGKKSNKSIELLGADIKTVRTYIEKQFLEGMTWQNHGEWHFDHCIPCYIHDMSNEDEQKKCFNYKNMQPMWSEDNIKKSYRIFFPDEIIKKTKK